MRQLLRWYLLPDGVLNTVCDLPDVQTKKDRIMRT